MYVCICRRITDSQVADAVCKGATCIKDVNQQVGAPVQCGKCCQFMKKVIVDIMDKISSQDHSSPASC